MLSKSKGNFMFWTISYLRKLNKYKWQFSDHILYRYHTIFYVYHRPKNRPNGMWKNLSLMLDSSKKNDGSISFFIFSNLQWISAFTEFPSITFSNIHAFNRLTCVCAVLLRQLVCCRVGGVAQLSRTIAVSSALSVEMLQSVADRWRCSKMVWESKVPRRSPIQLLAEPNLA